MKNKEHILEKNETESYFFHAQKGLCQQIYTLLVEKLLKKNPQRNPEIEQKLKEVLQFKEDRKYFSQYFYASGLFQMIKVVSIYTHLYKDNSYTDILKKLLEEIDENVFADNINLNNGLSKVVLDLYIAYQFSPIVQSILEKGFIQLFGKILIHVAQNPYYPTGLQTGSTGHIITLLSLRPITKNSKRIDEIVEALILAQNQLYDEKKQNWNFFDFNDFSKAQNTENNEQKSPYLFEDNLNFSNGTLGLLYSRLLGIQHNKLEELCTKDINRAIIKIEKFLSKIETEDKLLNKFLALKINSLKTTAPPCSIFEQFKTPSTQETFIVEFTQSIKEKKHISLYDDLMFLDIWNNKQSKSQELEITEENLFETICKEQFPATYKQLDTQQRKEILQSLQNKDVHNYLTSFLSEATDTQNKQDNPILKEITDYEKTKYDFTQKLRNKPAIFYHIKSKESLSQRLKYAFYSDDEVMKLNVKLNPYFKFLEIPRELRNTDSDSIIIYQPNRYFFTLFPSENNTLEAYHFLKTVQDNDFTFSGEDILSTTEDMTKKEQETIYKNTSLLIKNMLFLEMVEITNEDEEIVDTTEMEAEAEKLSIE